MAGKSVRGASSDEQIRLLNAIRRGDVLRVDLKGAVGHELRGPHYCVVVSNDILNADLMTFVVVPCTTHDGTGKVKKAPSK